MPDATRLRLRGFTEYVAGDRHGAQTRVPEISGCGFRIWTPRTPQRLGLHSHGHWEFCHLVSGAMDWRIEDELHALRSDDLFVIRPGERHDGADHIRHRSAICWLGLSQPIDELPGLGRDAAQALAAGFAALPSRRFPADAATRSAFADVLAAMRLDDPLAPLLVRAALHRLLAGVLVCQRAHAARAADPAPDERLQRAAAILRERVGAPIAVAELARAVGVSRTVLHERFVAVFGLSPMAWWTRLRIERAKQLLVGGASNAACAVALGFASAPHFAAVFRRTTGASPRAWLAARRRDGGG